MRIDISDQKREMMKNNTILILVCAAGVLAGTACDRAPRPADLLADRGRALLDSIYVHYGVAGEALLRENYPYDGDYKATYLAGEDSSQGNPYSYLWPFSGTASAVRALYDVTGDSMYIDIFDSRVVTGLDEYRDTLRLPVAYASYVSSAPASDRFYDDNVWLGIDFTDMYLSTGRTDYLDRAKEIWRFIESGTDDVLGGGIYWCEQKKESKNTCSNAPGSVYALKLFEATGDSLYLGQGKDLYEWTRGVLQDTTDCLYFDNISLAGDIGKAKYAYNSGQMMQAASILYRLTGDERYLDEARCIASSAFRHFFDGGMDADGKFPLLSKGNVWFTAVMMRGYDELYGVDGDGKYMDAFVSNLDHAWNVMRDPATGLFDEDWSGGGKRDRKWLLTQGAMAEMYATAAGYEKSKSE